MNRIIVKRLVSHHINIIIIKRELNYVHDEQYQAGNDQYRLCVLCYLGINIRYFAFLRINIHLLMMLNRYLEMIKIRLRIVGNSSLIKRTSFLKTLSIFQTSFYVNISENMVIK